VTQRQKEVSVSRTPVKSDAQPPRGLEQLDAVLQHRSRLGAMVLLSGADLSFTRLKTLLGETDGNLGAQLRKLEDTGYVSVKKEFADRKPVSWYTLTPAGQKALKAHLAAMEDLIKAARA
jgi:DNA-binding MarR family transcriptional regulator